ncbi:hypothetical protein BDA96_04G037600 [Sorghum bicolor]|nr:uncharacterized protein LOC110434946 isoform X1 [Sorghum bicolor]KAG0531614.1 hypothetical protein BDA96_04G037600 [Sorghum bicolor]|eukprot:XP_021315694.1 uncharacterized protein LOC110434946 isoform X1 [Sorghum bicolor]
MTAPPPPVRVTCDGIGTVPKLQPQQESGSESDFELDSPPHLTKLEYQELDTTPESPSRDTSPQSPPPLIDRGPPVLPTFGSDIEEWHSPYDQEDPYFESLMDNFLSASGDVCKSMLPAKNTIYKERSHQQQSIDYAVSALKHYNNNENNKVKYELIDAITSGGMIDMNDGYGHVNFTAKANQENSKEELFFAELRFHDNNTYIATCVLSLEGEKSVGGLCGSKYDYNKDDCFIDAKHCYACGRGLKHPKNGALYEGGHVACSDYYHGC